MSETCHYPEAEHYNEPQTPLEVIAEELRLYPDAASFRRSIYGLSKMYGKMPLLESFKKYSCLMNAMKVGNGAEGNPIRMDTDFNVGTIFATHVLLKMQAKPYRQAILRIDPLEGLEEIENNKEQLTDVMDSLEAWEAGTYQELFENQEEEYQELILAAAERCFADRPESTERVEAFKSGYMFAAYRIYDYDKYVKPYGMYFP